MINRFGGFRPFATHADPCCRAKRSAAKVTVGGCKTAVRLLDAAGRALADEVVVGACAPDGPPLPAVAMGRSLQVSLVRGGEIVHHQSLDEARRHHRAAMAELPPHALDLAPGPPAIEVHLIPEGDPSGTSPRFRSSS